MAMYKINHVKNSRDINTFMFSCINIKYVRHDVHMMTSHFNCL